MSSRLGRYQGGICDGIGGGEREEEGERKYIIRSSYLHLVMISVSRS